MGIADLWHLTDHTELDLDEIGSKFYTERGRMPVVAMDMYIVMFELLDGTRATGWANFHHQFMRRLNMFLSAGIVVVGVFDGPNKRHKLRNATEPKTPLARPLETRLVEFMKKIMQAFGFQVLFADGEGETLVAHLQRAGRVDFAFSKDSDVLACGATRALRFAKAKTKKRLVEVYEVDPDRQWAFLLYAVLVGHDFGKGAERIGGEQGKNLVAVPELVTAFKVWYDGGSVGELVQLVEDELHSKAHGTLKRGWNKSRRLDPLVFDREVVRAWVEPTAPRGLYQWTEPSAKLLQQYWDQRSPMYNEKEHAKAKAQREEARRLVAEAGKEPIERAERTETVGPVLYSLWLTWLLASGAPPPLELKIITRKPIAGKEFAVRLDTPGDGPKGASGPSPSLVPGQPSCAPPDKILVPYHLYVRWEAAKPKPKVVEKPKKAPAHTQKLAFTAVSKEDFLKKARAQLERVYAKEAKKVPLVSPPPSAPTGASPGVPLPTSAAHGAPPGSTVPSSPAPSTPITTIFIDLCDDDTDNDEPVLAPVSSTAPLPPSPEKVQKERKKTSPKRARKRSAPPARPAVPPSRRNQTQITAFYSSKV